MKKEILTGFVTAIVVTALAIVYTWSGKPDGSSNLNGYGITLLLFGIVELLAGMLFVLFSRSRYYGAGILMASLLTLLVGYSICSGVNFRQ